MPLVVHGGARVEDLVDRFVAATRLRTSLRLRVPEAEVEDVVRVAPAPLPDRGGRSSGRGAARSRSSSSSIAVSAAAPRRRAPRARLHGSHDGIRVRRACGTRAPGRTVLTDVGKHGWVVLMKDDAIRRRPAGATLSRRRGARFLLTKRSSVLPSRRRALSRTSTACRRRPSPAVHLRRLRRQHSPAMVVAGACCLLRGVCAACLVT